MPLRFTLAFWKAAVSHVNTVLRDKIRATPDCRSRGRAVTAPFGDGKFSRIKRILGAISETTMSRFGRKFFRKGNFRTISAKANLTFRISASASILGQLSISAMFSKY
jgi:hypothetical protein